jgi:16S rRNA (cytosine967-C5)-methyltransferase
MGGSGKFPRILLDAPCSGLGVLRKKPEIKWTRSQKDIQSLAALQLRMLQVGCELLESGGILIYSTCTLTDEENQGVIRSILEQRQDMKLVALDHPGLESKGGVITTFPHLHGLDGFFIAKLKKVV